MTTDPGTAPAAQTQGDPGGLFEAYGVFPAERLARVFGPEDIETYRAAWARLTSRSAALLGEKLASCPDSEIAAVVQDLLDAVAASTPVSPYEGKSVAAVKELVGNDVDKAKVALEYEQANSARQTLVDALSLVIAEGTVGIEVRDVEQTAVPRVGSVIDAVGGETEAGSTT